MGTGKSMKTDRLVPIYSDPCPFASAYIEVSRDLEQGNRVVELGVRAVAEKLAERGAPPEVVSDVRERLLRSTGQPAPISRVWWLRSAAFCSTS